MCSIMALLMAVSVAYGNPFFRSELLMDVSTGNLFLQGES